MKQIDTQIILSKLEELDTKIGTPEYSKYRDEFITKYLPKQHHLDFGLWSKKHCITDRYGARVM